MKHLLLLTLLASPTFANNNHDAEEAPIDSPEPEAAYSDAVAFNRLAVYFQSNPDYAGSTLGLRVGAQFKVIDRSAEKKSTPKYSRDALLDKLIGAVSTNSSLHISLTREGSKGERKEEKLA